jgi:amino acid synthesis protein
MTALEVRKVLTIVEEIRTEGGRSDPSGPLVKAAALAVIRNPYAGRAVVADLDELVGPSPELGALLGERVAGALGRPVESYGKGALVGAAGEQEHAVACITTPFGNAFREAVGGGRAWLSSITKRCAPGEIVDVPLAYKDEIWVRSHYDGITVRVPDAPLPEEIVVIAAVASGPRLHERLGGMTKAEAGG